MTDREALRELRLAKAHLAEAGEWAAGVLRHTRDDVAALAATNALVATARAVAELERRWTLMGEAA